MSLSDRKCLAQNSHSFRFQLLLNGEHHSKQCGPTMRAVDRWVRGAFFELFRGFEFFRFKGESQPSHLPLTRAVETVEKVSFQKIFFEKWDKNAERCLVFYVLNHILAVFEPVVGDFYEHFSNQGFFDSLVGQRNLDTSI